MPLKGPDRNWFRAFLLLFSAPEVAMQTDHKLTKQDQRELMRVLKDRRERRTPQHHSPSWLHRFWKAIAS